MESLQNNSRKGKKTSKLELYLYEANSLSFIKIILFSASTDENLLSTTHFRKQVY